MIASKASFSLSSSYPAHTNENQNTGKNKVTVKGSITTEVLTHREEVTGQKRMIFLLEVHGV